MCDYAYSGMKSAQVTYPCPEEHCRLACDIIPPTVGAVKCGHWLGWYRLHFSIIKVPIFPFVFNKLPVRGNLEAVYSTVLPQNCHLMIVT